MVRDQTKADLPAVNKLVVLASEKLGVFQRFETGTEVHLPAGQ